MIAPLTLLAIVTAAMLGFVAGLLYKDREEIKKEVKK